MCILWLPIPLPSPVFGEIESGCGREQQLPKLKNSTCGFGSFASSVIMISIFNSFCLGFPTSPPFSFHVFGEIEESIHIHSYESGGKRESGKTPNLKNSNCRVSCLALKIMRISIFNPLCGSYGSQFPYLPLF